MDRWHTGWFLMPTLGHSPCLGLPQFWGLVLS